MSPDNLAAIYEIAKSGNFYSCAMPLDKNLTMKYKKSFIFHAFLSCNPFFLLYNAALFFFSYCCLLHGLSNRLIYMYSKLDYICTSIYNIYRDKKTQREREREITYAFITNVRFKPPSTLLL